MATVPRMGRAECPVDPGCSRRPVPPRALPAVLHPQQRRSEAVGDGSIVLSPSSEHLAEIVLQREAQRPQPTSRKGTWGPLLEEILSGCAVIRDLSLRATSV